jgi:hypothetical protein
MGEREEGLAEQQGPLLVQIQTLFYANYQFNLTFTFKSV